MSRNSWASWKPRLTSRLNFNQIRIPAVPLMQAYFGGFFIQTRMAGFKRIIVENRYQKNKTQRTLCFRSGWEVSFASFLDSNTNVANWESDYRIKYLDKYNYPPKVRMYLIDFKIQMTDGSILLVEVKPLSTLRMRVQTNSMRYKRIHTTNYLKNLAKFETVEIFCRKVGWKFFLTQKEENGFKFYRWDIKDKRPVSIQFICENNK